MHSTSYINMSESVKELSAALMAFQSEVPVLGKNADGYGYKYVTLDKIQKTIYPIMARHGLSLAHPLGNVEGEPALVSILMHTSGEWISTAYPLTKTGLAKANDAQQFGASIKYATRYNTNSLLGVPIGDEDDDAACLIEKPRPAGQKYPPEQGTLVDDLIAEMRNQTDLDSLGKYMKKIKPTVQGLPDFAQKKISAEYMVHRGEVEAREGRQS